MKSKRIFSYLLTGGGLLLPMTAFSALFQNSNLPCSSQAVLCSSGDCPSPNFNFSTHLSCGNLKEASDFNNDQYVDCVVGITRPPTTAETQEADTQEVSLLLNDTSGNCPGGFNASLDYQVPPAAGEAFFGSIVSGKLDNNTSTDFALPVWKIPSGIENVIQAFNPGSDFGVDGTALTTFGSEWQLDNAERLVSTFYAQPTAVLLDCNNDGNLDLAIGAIKDSNPDAISAAINVMFNNSNGLNDVVSAISLNGPFTNEINGISLAPNDFNGDGIDDLAILIKSSQTNKIEVCLNNGSCGFTCNETPLGNGETPFSITSGDYDGDGDKDLAYSDEKAGNINFVMNNGSGTFALGPSASAGNTERNAYVVSTGCITNDNREDVVVSLGTNPVLALESPIQPRIGIIGLDSTSTPQITQIDFTNLGTAPFTDLGIAAVNLHDKIGAPFTRGDDIVALARSRAPILPTPPYQDRLYVFMNEIEALSAAAGNDQNTEINSPINIQGTCQLTPEDAQAEFGYQWTLTEGDPANVQLQGDKSSQLTFQATAPGTYKLTLQCRTTCRVLATDEVIIQVTDSTGGNNNNGGGNNGNGGGGSGTGGGGTIGGSAEGSGLHLGCQFNPQNGSFNLLSLLIAIPTIPVLSIFRRRSAQREQLKRA